MKMTHHHGGQHGKTILRRQVAAKERLYISQRHRFTSMEIIELNTIIRVTFEDCKVSEARQKKKNSLLLEY